MAHVPLVNRLLLVVTDRAVVYQSELIKEFTSSEDIRNHGEVYEALYSLVRKNKISLIKKDGVDLVCKVGVAWQ